jgi:hypothetical protein
MPLRTDPTTAAADWAAGLSQSTAKITRGIDRVQQAPGAKAAAKADKWLSGVQQSKDKFARNVGAVTLNDWQTATKDAVGRVAEGATRKQGKFAERIAPVFTHMAGVLNAVDNMPDTTLDQRINKSAEFQRRMAGYRSGGGSR